MDEQAVQRLRAEVVARKNLPTIPTVLAKILQLVDSESSSGRDLIAVIEHDQALTGKMLRLANSAFFGQSRKVATIPRAVVLLGFSTVRNLALGVKVWDALGNGIAKTRLEELWSHAVAVAAAGRSLATRLGGGDPDEAFTAGLLHDVGRLVLAMRFRDDYWRAVGGAHEGGDLETLEREVVGVDHAEVGAWILEAWSLPPGIIEAVRAHHGDTTQPGVSGVLALTDRLIGLTDLGSGAVRREAEALLGTGGLTLAGWHDVLQQLRDGGEIAALAALDD